MWKTHIACEHAVKGQFEALIYLSFDSNSKIDFVLIYLDDPPVMGGEYLRRCEYGYKREDIKNTFGSDYLNSGFSCSFDPDDFRPGPHVFYIYFHSSDFGWKHIELKLIIKSWL